MKTKYKQFKFNCKGGSIESTLGFVKYLESIEESVTMHIDFTGNENESIISLMLLDEFFKTKVNE